MGPMTTSTPPGRSYAGASAAERSAGRRRRLVEAALDLVGEGGVAALTVGGVCERAGVAKRYFYESFGSLDDLLGQALSDALEPVAADIAAASTAEVAAVEPLQRAAVEAVLGVFDDPRVARMYLESPGHAGLRTARERAIDGFVAQFLDLLGVGQEGREPARVLAHVVIAGTTDVVARWLRGDLHLERAALVERLVALGSDATRLIQQE